MTTVTSLYSFNLSFPIGPKSPMVPAEYVLDLAQKALPLICANKHRELFDLLGEQNIPLLHRRQAALDLIYAKALHEGIENVPLNLESVCKTVYHMPRYLIPDNYRATPSAYMSDFIAKAAHRSHVATPFSSPLSLEDVFAHPEKHKNGIEVVLFDVDGTTKAGQGWLQWLLWDVMRFGPKASTGGPISEVVRALWRAIPLKLKDLKGGDANSQEIMDIIGRTLPFIEMDKIHHSWIRFHENFGRRQLSPFAIEEILKHQAAGHLVILSSASPEDLVVLHGDDLGVPRSNVFGTRFVIDPANNRPTGDFFYNHGESKPILLEWEVFRPLRDLGIPVETIAAYSDSASDIRLLEIALRDGGQVFGANARKALEKWVLERGGMTVREKRGGRTALVSGGDERTGIREQDLKRIEVPPERYPDFDDLKARGKDLIPSAAGLALGAALTTRIIDEFGHLTLLQVIESLVAGTAAAGVGNLFIPKSGEVSASRRWLMSDFLPLSALALFVGHALNGTFQPGEGVNAFVIGMAMAAGSLVSTGTTRSIVEGVSLLAHGFGWKPVERAMEGRTLEFLTRPAQMTMFGFASIKFIHWLHDLAALFK